MKVVVIGAGAGGAAAVAELTAAGHDVTLWNRSADTLSPFAQRGGVAFEGVLGSGLARPRAMTADIADAMENAEVAVVTLPTFSHASVAQTLAKAGWPSGAPVILNPGHTGGALEFANAYRAVRMDLPPVAEFSTLTYVARKYRPDQVTISGRAKQVRVAALPGGKAALAAACTLFPGATPVADVLATDLSNVNLVLHPPGAILGAAWVEARAGDFTFYVDAMTAGVGRVVRQLDEERRAVAKAFGHELPNLIEEMQLIGTVEQNIPDTGDYVGAISGGSANRQIKAPDSFNHRYYREDFGHGLVPFLAMANVAGVPTPVAKSLLVLAEGLCGIDFSRQGRTAESMGIAGLSKAELLQKVRHG